MPLSYLEWNDLLAKNYFNEEMADKEVILFADQDAIDQIGHPYNEGYDQLRHAVIEGPPWAKSGGICQKAVHAYLDWRSRGLKYPPYIVYLVFFVSVATIEGDFDTKAYYPRLRRVLGEPEITGLYPSFDKMDELWDDLEKWSTEDKYEAIGRFTKRVRGKWVNVGVPLSQVILSDGERKILPKFFYEEGLDPVDPPTDDTLLKRFTQWGKKCLNHRTVILLSSPGETLGNLKEALAEFVMNDLCEWDGTYLDDTPRETAPSHSYRQAQVGAHICLEIDTFAETIKAFLRIKANRVFPDWDLSFDFGGKSLICRGSGAPGWSTKLMVDGIDERKVFDATILDWSQSYTFIDNEDAWTSRLRGSKVRIFLPGQAEGLPDWVERQRVIPRSKYLICCHKDVSASISEWGKTSNASFKKLIFSGLPNNWELFSADNIKTSYNGSDALTLPSKSILHIQGGIRVGKTNRYLNFAPPQIIVDQGSETVQLTINGTIIQPKTDQGIIYSLPEGLPLDTSIVIGLLSSDGSIMQRRVIYLTSINTPVLPEKPIIRDKFGNTILRQSDMPTDIEGISGAVPIGGVLCEHRSSTIVVPTYLSQRIIFLGKVVGQVIDWPDEDIPQDWYPVWAIAKLSRNKWQVHFCGDPDDMGISPKHNSIPQKTKAAKRWKEVIWSMRKQIAPPKFKVYKALWRQYMECASSV